MQPFPWTAHVSYLKLTTGTWSCVTDAVVGSTLNAWKSTTFQVTSGFVVTVADSVSIEKLLCFCIIVALRLFLFLYVTCLHELLFANQYFWSACTHWKPLYLGVTGSWGESLYPRTEQPGGHWMGGVTETYDTGLSHNWPEFYLGLPGTLTEWLTDCLRECLVTSSRGRSRDRRRGERTHKVGIGMAHSCLCMYIVHSIHAFTAF